MTRYLDVSDNRKWCITILWPAHTGAGAVFDPVERYDHCTLLDRDEGYFGIWRFQDEIGLEHLVSCAWAFKIDEEQP